MWKQVWQMACRAEDIPAPGDFVEYVVGDQSFLVVRGDDHTIRAFANACRHRGNTLRTGAGHCGQIRCRYHGWTWALDGRLADIPDRHLTVDVCDDDYHLAEAAVGDVLRGYRSRFSSKGEVFSVRLGPPAGLLQVNP